MKRTLDRARNSTFAQRLREGKGEKVEALDQQQREVSIPSPTVPVPKTAIDKENVNPDDDGFEFQKHQLKKLKKVEATNAVIVATADLQKAEERDLKEDWNDRRAATTKARGTMKTYNTNQARKWENRRQAAVYDRPAKTAVIGQQGHRNVVLESERTLQHHVKFSDLKPGLIVRHLDTNPIDGHPTIRPHDAGTWMDSRGRWYHEKSRFFIIANRHPGKVVEVGIYTFGDTGAENIRDNEKYEYLNLKPKGANDYEPQIPGAPVLEIGVKLSQHKLERRTMVVRISTPQTRELACDELEKVAQLTDDSLQLLIQARKDLEGHNSLMG